MATAEILVIVYGSCARDPENDERYGAEQRRVEITLRPTLPSSATTPAKREQWLWTFLPNLALDMKHNRNWRCEFCKNRARETYWMNAPWMHLNPPRVVSYVHHVCDAGAGPCAERLRQINAEVARQTGLPPAANLPPTDQVFPLSASCAVCHNETEKSRKNLKQCSRCELTRYCGVDCQRADWRRHKVCCAAVKEVKWHWT
ncbi:MYND-type domain-containing protein [Mycena sanguinolenta]|uniref:MYND-type domain-containing protein n=1 Tax=Mycena sanguinolenta TaxID=230812 RepID=A0A8H6ZHW0_9AGAR|nr:MYND-type domain-containing protein [Mycena sanguinolenta]